jgi:hypothetical protein
VTRLRDIRDNPVNQDGKKPIFVRAGKGIAGK